MAIAGDEEIEVECKVLTHELGMKITPDEFERLFRHITREEILRSVGDGRVVICHVLPDDKLPKDERRIGEIGRVVLSLLRQRGSSARRAGIEYLIEEWDPGLSGPEAVFEEARRITRSTGMPTMAFADERRGAIIGMKSRSADYRRPLEASKRPLRQAVSQLSATRPACLFVNTEAIGRVAPEKYWELATIAAMLVIDVGRTRSYLQGAVWGYPGEPFNIGETLWIPNPEHTAEPESKEFKRLRDMARPGATPTDVRKWQEEVWEQRWK